MKSKITATIIGTLTALATAPSFARAETLEEICGPEIQKILLAECRVDVPYDQARMVESSYVNSGNVHYSAKYHHSWIQRAKYLYIITDSFGQVTQREVNRDTQQTAIYSASSAFAYPGSFSPEWVRVQAKRKFDIAMLEVSQSQCKE